MHDLTHKPVAYLSITNVIVFVLFIEILDVSLTAEWKDTIKSFV